MLLFFYIVAIQNIKFYLLTIIVVYQKKHVIELLLNQLVNKKENVV